MAQYPNTIPTFTTKHNITDVVDENDPNSIQSEVTAVATELGANPRISSALATTYANVDARLEWIEANYRLISNHDSHAALSGLAGDDHTQYARVDGSRAFTGSTAITALPVAVAVGDTQSQGALHTLARSDHRHAHAGGSPVASAVTDTAADGVATTVARSDHKHAREGFGAASDGTAYGAANTPGVAATVSHSDHVHGTPALTAAAPSTQALGDTPVVGVATAPARADHKHGMPAFSTTVSDETTFSLAPSAGVAATVSRGDHTHGSTPSSLTGPSGMMAVWPTNTPPSGWLICDGSAVSRTTYSVLFGIISTTYGVGDGSTTFNLPNLKGRVIVGRDAADTDWDVLGETRGTKTETLAISQIPSHDHSAVTGGQSVDHTHSGTTNNEAGHYHGTGNAGAHTHSMYPGWGGTADIVPVSVGGGSAYWLGQGASGVAGPIVVFSHTYDPGDHNHGNTGGGVNHNHGFGSGGVSAGHTHSVGAQGGGAFHNNLQPSIVFNYVIKT